MGTRGDIPEQSRPFGVLYWRITGFLSALTVAGSLLAGLVISIRGVLTDPVAMAVVDLVGILICVFSASFFLALAYLAWPREG